MEAACCSRDEIVGPSAFESESERELLTRVPGTGDVIGGVAQLPDEVFLVKGVLSPSSVSIPCCITFGPLLSDPVLDRVLPRGFALDGPGHGFELGVLFPGLSQVGHCGRSPVVALVGSPLEGLVEDVGVGSVGADELLDLGVAQFDCGDGLDLVDGPRAR